MLLVHDVVLRVHQLVVVGQRAVHDAQDKDLHPGTLQQAHLVPQREVREACRERGPAEWQRSGGWAGQRRRGPAPPFHLLDSLSFLGEWVRHGIHGKDFHNESSVNIDSCYCPYPCYSMVFFKCARRLFD